MEIALESLAAEAFSLALPIAGSEETRQLVLGDVLGLRGGLHTEPGLVKLINASLERGRIDGLRWPLSSGHVASNQPISVSDLAVDADFPGAGATSTHRSDISAAAISALSMQLSMPNFQLTSDVALEKATIAIANGEVATRAETAKLENLQFQLGELLIRGALSAATLRTESGGDGPLTIVCGKAESVELGLVHPKFEVTAAGVELASGFAFKGGELRIDEMHVGAVRFLLPLDPPEPDAPPSGEKVRLESDVICLGERRLFDLRDLDSVSGHGEIAVFVKAQLPVVGGYKLDRTFKIPIKDGSIDFVDVERQLGTIEDAFIDFAVRDGELIIKRDIPLLPTKGKKLVSWPLTTVEEALARTRLVSLRALTRFQLAKPKDGDSKANITAVKLDVPALTLSAPETPTADENKDSSDAEFQLRSFQTLSVAGNLQLDSKARKLDGTLRGSSAVVRVAKFPVGDSLFSATAIRLGELSVEVADWDGLRPRALAIEIKDLAIEGLTLRAEAGS